MCGHWSQAPCTQPISNQETRCQARRRLIKVSTRTGGPEPKPVLDTRSPPACCARARYFAASCCASRSSDCSKFQIFISFPLFQQLLLRSCQSVSSSSFGMLVPVVCLEKVSKQAEPSMRRGASHSLHGEDRGVVSCVWAAFGFRPCRHRLLVVCPSVRAQGSSNRVMRLRFSSASVRYVLVCRRCAGARLSTQPQ